LAYGVIGGLQLSSWVWVTPRMRENRAGRPLTSGVLGAGEGRNSV
jgi:hypothetical protein